MFLTLLILFDLCYRIGTGWWASVVGHVLAVVLVAAAAILLSGRRATKY